LRAAIHVFANHGYHQTRISDIARAAGVADGTIYLYFPSKEELLVSLLDDRVSKLLAFMQRDVPKLANAPERLRAIIDMQLGLLEGDRELAEIVTIIVRQSSRLIKQAPTFVAYLDAIECIIQQGQQSGELRSDISASVAARAIFGALDGTALTWALGRAEPAALARAARQVGDILLRGLCPEPLPLPSPP